MSETTSCQCAEGFTFREKLWAQISFNAFAIVGVIGIALVDWRWAVPYAFIYLYGIPFIVMRHLTCPRCPHLLTYGDCLQFPPSLTRMLIRSEKHTALSSGECVLFLVIFILLPLYPLYWLTEHPVLLAVFLVCAGTWYTGQLAYFCKRCRVDSCPFNRTV
jgi:hypothetical protein